jgi:hypothetical protein
VDEPATPAPLRDTPALDRPPGRVLAAAIGALLLILVVSTSVPGWLFVGWFLGGGLLAVLLLLWLVRFTGAASAARRASRTPPADGGGPPPGSWRGPAVLAVPVLLVLAGALVVLDVPLRARWQLSRPAFDDAVTGAMGSPDAVPVRDGRTIGLYRVDAATRFGDAVVFTDADGGFFGGGGFAYLPGGPVDGVQDESYERPTYTDLGSGWYAWTAPF